MRYEIDLAQSQNVSITPQEVFQPPAGLPLKNTGIERDGGLTNIAASYSPLVPGNTHRYTLVDEQGNSWSLGDAPYKTGCILYKNGSFYKVLGSSRIAYRGIVPGGYDDYVLAKNLDRITILACRMQNLNVVVDEFSLDGVKIGGTSRGVGGLSDVVNFVRRFDMTLATANEFIGQDLSTGVVAHLNASTGVATAIVGLTPTSGYPFYAYKYASAGNYIVFDPARRFCFVSNISVGALGASIPCWYLSQEDNGIWDRHIITKKPILNGASIEAAARIGHTTLSAAFSAVPVWQTPAGINASAVRDEFAIGPNYVEALYTDNVSGRPAWFAYGLYGSAPTQYLEQTNLANGAAYIPTTAYRINVLANKPDFISIEDHNNPQAGVVLTGVGEVDHSYVTGHQFHYFGVDDFAEAVLYKTDSGFALCVVVGGRSKYNQRLGVNEIPPIQTIGDGLLKIATSSPWSVIDVAKSSLVYSGCDYHGAIQPVYSAPSPGGVDLMVARIESTVFNTVDPGETQVAKGWGWINCYGISLDAPADVYVNATYFASYDRIALTGTPVSFPHKEGTLYVPSQALPLPSGVIHYGRGASLPEASFQRIESKDAYLIGNTLPGLWVSFSLFSQDYLLSGGWIHSVLYDSAGFIQETTKVARAEGLRLFAIAPAVAYFYSEWDNAIYTFDGGQSVSKLVGLTQEGLATQGAFSTHENALYIDVGGKFLAQRDGILSEIAKTANQVTFSRFFPTNEGMAVVDSGGVTYYRYYGGPPMPLEYKTAYFGIGGLNRSKLLAAYYTIYNPAKTAITVTVGIDSFDETDDYSQRETVIIGSGDWSSAGYKRIRLQPEDVRGLGASLYFQCASKVWLTNLAVEFDQDISGVIPEGSSV